MSVLIETALTVRPIGIFDRFVDIFANEALGLTKRHGFDLIGAWRRSAGTAQQVLHVHRFDSLAAYEQARASIQRDPARLGLPEKFGAEMSIAEVSSVGAPTPYATEARLENALSQAAPPLGYLQRISRVHFPHREEVVELVGKIVDAVEATGAISLVTAYEATIGRSSDVSDLFLLPRVRRHCQKQTRQSGPSTGALSQTDFTPYSKMSWSTCFSRSRIHPSSRRPANQHCRIRCVRLIQSGGD